MKPVRNATHAAPSTLRVAYHDGPPEISFAGRIWRKGDPQEVSAAEWAAMRARGDCPHFDFRPVSEPKPALDFSEE